MVNAFQQENAYTTIPYI